MGQRLQSVIAKVRPVSAEWQMDAADTRGRVRPRKQPPRQDDALRLIRIASWTAIPVAAPT